MAKNSDKKTGKQQKIKPTMRDLANTTSEPKKPSRMRRAAGKASSPLGKIFSFGAREYNPIKLPDNKAGRILGKRIHIFPKFLRNAWAEIRQATWPNRRETARLSFAVFVFAAIFSVIVAGLDLALDKLFREFIIKV